jgi:hypothetical protein
MPCYAWFFKGVGMQAGPVNWMYAISLPEDALITWLKILIPVLISVGVSSFTAWLVFRVTTRKETEDKKNRKKQAEGIEDAVEVGLRGCY